jgi:hypothetical protein
VFSLGECYSYRRIQSLIRENTNGSNGLALTKEGDLVFAEGDGKRISKRNKDGTIVTLTEGPPGAPLLAPRRISDSKERLIAFEGLGLRGARAARRLC